MSPIVKIVIWGIFIVVIGLGLLIALGIGLITWIARGWVNRHAGTPEAPKDVTPIAHITQPDPLKMIDDGEKKRIRDTWQNF